MNSLSCDGCKERDRKIRMLENHVEYLMKSLKRLGEPTQHYKSLALNYELEANEPNNSKKYEGSEQNSEEENGKEMESIEYGDGWPGVKCEDDSVSDTVEVKPEMFIIEQHQDSKSTFGKNGKTVKKETSEADSKAHNKQMSYFECYICKLVFKTLKEVKLHLKSHRKYQECTICFETLKRTGMEYHLCAKDDQQINCEYCDFCSTSIKNLLEYLKSHNDDIKLYKCPECPRFFAMNILLKYHQIFHERNVKSLICSICSRTYEYVEKIRLHMRTHKKVKTSNLCDQCGKSFSTIYNLKLHAKSHEEPNIKCPECPQMFRNKYAMKAHRHIHSDVKYACTICGAELSSPKVLARHKRFHHSSKEKIREECEVCLKTYKNRKQLLKHMKLHSTDRTRFQCSFCKMSYQNRCALNKHLKTHLGVEIYKCDECDMRFKLPLELRKHSFLHYKEKMGSSENMEHGKEI